MKVCGGRASPKGGVEDRNIDLPATTFLPALDLWTSPPIDNFTWTKLDISSCPPFNSIPVVSIVVEPYTHPHYSLEPSQPFSPVSPLLVPSLYYIKLKLFYILHNIHYAWDIIQRYVSILEKEYCSVKC